MYENKIFSSIQNSVRTRRKVEKQGGKKIDKNRLDHRLDFIQKNFCFRKRNIFLTDPSKIKQLFFLPTLIYKYFSEFPQFYLLNTLNSTK